MGEEPRNGHMNEFNGEWFFDYNVADTEGLCLLNGYYRGRYAFRKLSLPVIRVKYTQDIDLPFFGPHLGNGCGPYNDQISWDPQDPGENLENHIPLRGPHHLIKLVDCGNRYVCKRVITDANGINWIEMGVYARIVAYHIYQAWYLSRDGVIRPQVQSKGLSCNLDHWHHPYWRFHFDLDENQSHRLNLFDEYQFKGIQTDEAEWQNTDVSRYPRYQIENRKTRAKVWITPPTPEVGLGIVGPDYFSKWDAVLRKYRPEEDRNWPHPPRNEISFPVHEYVDNSDLVFWSICHLYHRAAEGGDHWHWVGPEIRYSLPKITSTSEEQSREVVASGNMHIKDYILGGQDQWGHYTFNDTRTINPNMPNGEISVWNAKGDVSAELFLRFKLQDDNSVSLKIWANLYDEEDRVARVPESNYNVLAGGWLDFTIHLKDYHWGDRDTADMDFRIENKQAY